MSILRALFVGLLVLFLGGYINLLEAKPGDEPKDKFERPYKYEFKDDEVVKKYLKYPELNWQYDNGFSCINQGDFAYLIQFFIQLNGVIEQYETAIKEKEEGE